MKKMVCLLAGLLLIAVVYGQQTKTSGKIVFEKTRKIEIKISGDAAALASKLPKERRSQYTLLYNEKASIYELEKKNSNEDVVEHKEDGNTIMIKTVEPENKVFTDFTGKTFVRLQEFMTRKFIIESEAKTGGWKITGNQKTILGYPCTEAVKTVDTLKTVVWFTPAIPVSGGPEALGNCFPGMILEASLMNGKETIIAKSVSFEPVDAKNISKPNDGKKVTEEEFKKIVDEKLKESKAQGGGNQIIIKHVIEN